MGLTHKLAAPTGDEYPAAYWRVVGTVLYQGDGVGTIVARAYRDRAARDAGRLHVLEREFIVRHGSPAVEAVAALPERPDADGVMTLPAVPAVPGRAAVPSFAETFGNDAPPLAASYGYLKSLDEFAGAVDG